jgi:hypothetical protein
MDRGGRIYILDLEMAKSLARPRHLIRLERIVELTIVGTCIPERSSRGWLKIIEGH